MNINPRRATILKLLSEGFTNEQIAKELNISIRTVKDNISYLARSYGVPKGGRYATRIRLVVAATYECHPNLIPFNGGDRASRVGRMSSSIFASITLATESKNDKHGRCQATSPNMCHNPRHQSRKELSVV
jgi:FixJ family two-component response regulator